MCRPSVRNVTIVATVLSLFYLPPGFRLMDTFQPTTTQITFIIYPKGGILLLKLADVHIHPYI